METIIPSGDPNGAVWLEIGKLQAGQKYTDDRVARIEERFDGLEAKIDETRAGIAAIRETLAERGAGFALGKWMLTTLVAASGWLTALWHYWSTR